MNLFKRSSGILLHPTSLPGPHGIGDLGPVAKRFIDFLISSGQTWWQMLPLNSAGYGESPYNTLSAFAGNPLLISLDKLREDGLLSLSDMEPFSDPTPTKVSFLSVKNFKEQKFRKAFSSFQIKKEPNDFDSFCVKNKEWLSDYCLFMAIKKHQKGRPWVDWPRDLRRRKPEALKKMSTRLEEEISYHKFLQYQFRRQWNQLKQYATEEGVQLMGDIPIFVAHDSADVWCHPSLFKLKRNGHPSVMAGVPPDYFSKTGQLWGNPVYRWSVHKKDHYHWWVKRLKTSFQLFDAVRLDHFIGFYRTWEVGANQKTAEHGKWILGPRGPFFQHLLKELGPVKIVAEDLGFVIPPIQKLRKRFHFPGMVVLHFAFGGDIESVRKRLESLNRETVVYTGTHDNNTTQGWIREMTSSNQDLRNALTILGATEADVSWKMIQLALSLKPDLAIVPLQDVLGLGAEGRMNKPGTSEGNWEWRFEEKSLTEIISHRLFELTKKYKRLPPS